MLRLELDEILKMKVTNSQAGSNLLNLKTSMFFFVVFCRQVTSDLVLHDASDRSWQAVSKLISSVLTQEHEDWTLLSLVKRRERCMKQLIQATRPDSSNTGVFILFPQT